ncbi:protein tyrosine/serine phosphatase [Parvularcula bermudensis HTCC2503]|uniref:Protein tyrosine/serine phosphatase n=2 Tax=Parvularcula TaxID=208215 RepID=E0TII2_PARBH|nr:protein tyrosine/serine phosphatase [Parvularcula bermudensis HTCC2503]
MALALAGCVSVPDVRNLQIVDDGALLRSGQPTPLGLAELRDRYGVRMVINLDRGTSDDEMVVALALGLDYLAIPTATYGLERENLVTLLAALRQAERDGRTPVLVHCRSGQDRTGAAVAVFRTIEEDWSAEDAEAEMQRYRHWTHEILFPHLPDIAEEAEHFKAHWEEAIQRTGTVPVIRPPMRWMGTDDPAAGVARQSGVTVNAEPGVR